MQNTQTEQQQEGVKSVADLRNATKEFPLDTTPGFGNLAQYQTLQRMAMMLASSDSIPPAYRSIVMEGFGKNKKPVANDSAIANCAIAVDMSLRMQISVVSVMQNMHIIEGKPSWSSKFLIGKMNAAGVFAGRLRFALSEPGAEKEVPYEYRQWSDSQNKMETKKGMATFVERSCYCWAIDKETGDKLIGPTVTMDMALKEGWLTKNGSKWQTMPELMLQYRAASFFANLHCPDLTMGIPTAEEVEDVIEANIENDVMSVDIDGIKKGPATAGQKQPRNRQKEPDQGQDKGSDQKRSESPKNDSGDVEDAAFVEKKAADDSPESDQYISTASVAAAIQASKTAKDLEVAITGISSCDPEHHAKLHSMAGAVLAEINAKTAVGGSAQESEPPAQRRGRGQGQPLFEAE